MTDSQVGRQDSARESEARSREAEAEDREVGMLSGTATPR
jgi:hypothetical protein